MVINRDYTVLSAMSSSSATQIAPEQAPKLAPEDQVIPALFGEGEGLYPQRKDTFLYSFVLHMIAVGLLIWSGHWAFEHQEEIKQQVIGVVTDISPYLPMKISKTQAGGGGGGGDRDKLQAPKGALPKLAREQITPPAVVIRNDNPKLAVPPSVVVPAGTQAANARRPGRSAVQDRGTAFEWHRGRRWYR